MEKMVINRFEVIEDSPIVEVYHTEGLFHLDTDEIMSMCIDKVDEVNINVQFVISSKTNPAGEIVEFITDGDDNNLRSLQSLTDTIKSVLVAA